MNTPKKMKRWQDRTSAKSRTCKNRRGSRGTQNADWLTYGHHPVGEGMPLNYQDRMFKREVLNEFFTKSDVFLPMPIEDDDCKVQADESSPNREERRKERRLERRLNLTKLFRRKTG